MKCPELYESLTPRDSEESQGGICVLKSPNLGVASSIMLGSLVGNAIWIVISLIA